MRDIIIDLQEADTWKIQLKIAINYISSKDVEEERVMHSKSNNIKFTSYDDANEVVELFSNKKLNPVVTKLFKIPLINCEISLMLTWSNNCLLVAGTAVNQEPTFTVTDTKLYIPVVNLSTQDNIKLLKQLQSGFEITTTWNKYHSKIIEQAKADI